MTPERIYRKNLAWPVNLRFVLVIGGMSLYKGRDGVMTSGALASFGQGNSPESLLESCANDHETE